MAAVRAATMENKFSPFICSGGKNHAPKSAARRKEIRHWMFQAGFQGCLPCVKHCIEVIGVEPDIESSNKKFTAMSWAEWGKESGEPGNQEEVIAYLNDTPLKKDD